MQTYETIMIFTDKLTEEEYEAGVDHYTKVILDLDDDGIIKKTDKLGKKKLAYEVKGNEYGWYVVFTHKTNPDKIAELERRLRIDDNVIKFLTLKIDEETDEYEGEVARYVKTEEPEPKSEQHHQDVTTDAWDLVFNLKGGV